MQAGARRRNEAAARALRAVTAAPVLLVQQLTGLSLDHRGDLHDGADCSPLDVRGRFGTADSIDRPGR